jgi:hypothetical protein
MASAIENKSWVNCRKKSIKLVTEQIIYKDINEFTWQMVSSLLVQYCIQISE